MLEELRSNSKGVGYLLYYLSYLTPIKTNKSQYVVHLLFLLWDIRAAGEETVSMMENFV